MEKASLKHELDASLKRELDTLWGNANEAENFTIFRTPHNISKSKKNLFQPSVISIGPFHHGRKHLRAMEDQKRRFLRDFLSRGDHISLDLCISEMKLLEERTRRCYSETFDDLDSNAFVKMMLLDGCFLLEYFLKRYEGGKRERIEEVGWNYCFIDHDLLLLENQIPFFIVDKLYETLYITRPSSLNQEYRLIFIKYLAFHLLPRRYILLLDPPAKTPLLLPDLPTEIHHLVHLCCHYLVPNPGIPVVLSSKSFDLTRNVSSNVIASATELKQKGLKFRRKSNPKHMLDISFEYGVLKIPKLEITDSTKPIFANLIAFAHSKYGKKYSPFRRFVDCLDCLVNTPNDVTILQECGILENWLGSEEELAHFLNHVTEGNFVESNHYLAELYTEVNRYTESSWHRNRAKLIRDYFSSPWATISVVAAFILLVLTLVQSFFAVFSYFRPPSS